MRIVMLSSADRARIAAYYLALPQADLRRRFCGGVSAAFVEAYVARIDWTRASLYAACEGRRMIGLVELVRPPGPWMLAAEIAISVAPGHRRQGVGAALMRAAIACARNRFLAAVYIVTAVENRPMQALAATFGARFQTSFGEVEARIPLAWPGYDSLLDEALADGAAALDTLAALALPAGDGRA